MTRLTILYDNRSTSPELQADWGFACLIRAPERTILFDTGANAAILAANADALRVDLGAVDTVVLSHSHDDHAGGVDAVIAANPRARIYALPSTASRPRSTAPPSIVWTDVCEAMPIAEGIWTTGPLGHAIPEQSLVLHDAAGQIVLTGCAHPGIVSIVCTAARRGDVACVIGGFHLKDMTEEQSQATIDELRRRGVSRAAPCHCTGDRAMEQFAEAFGDDLMPAHVGATFTFGPLAT